MAVLNLPDLALHYETVGDGPPLFLVPGMLSDGASWAPLVPLLSPTHRLILPDPRGAGRTRPYDAPISLAALSADMAALVRHLGYDRVDVAGHSLGGLVALALAGHWPGLVRRVAVLASSPLPSARIPAVFSGLAALRAQSGGTLWVRQLLPWLFHDRFFRDVQAVEDAIAASLAYPHLQPLLAMQHQTRALARLDIATLPATLRAPALALLAEEDALIAPGPAGARLRAMGVRVEVLPDCAHSLHWDVPGVVANRLAEFLGETEGSSR